MESLLRLVRSTSLTVMALIAASFLLPLPTIQANAVAIAYDCSKCNCANDANDPDSAYYCTSATRTTCNDNCDCVKSANTGIYYCTLPQP